MTGALFTSAGESGLKHPRDFRLAVRVGQLLEPHRPDGLSTVPTA